MTPIKRITVTSTAQIIEFGDRVKRQSYWISNDIGQDIHISIEEAMTETTSQMIVPVGQTRFVQADINAYFIRHFGTSPTDDGLVQLSLFSGIAG